MMLCFDRKYLQSVGMSNSDIAGYFHDADQATVHFTVLRYRGMDSRRIIVDESNALYYLGIEKDLPRMGFIVSDNDMENRYEQTMLMLSTVKSYGYKGYDHIVMHGIHCSYCAECDADGNSVLTKMIFDFVDNE